jgi:hypothetical protein
MRPPACWIVSLGRLAKHRAIRQPNACTFSAGDNWVLKTTLLYGADVRASALMVGEGERGECRRSGRCMMSEPPKETSEEVPSLAGLATAAASPLKVSRRRISSASSEGYRRLYTSTRV